MKTITITNDNSYAAFPSASVMRDDRIAILYHKGASHVSADSKMVCRIGSPEAQAWGPETVVGADDTFAEQGGCIKALRDGTLLAFTWCLQVTRSISLAPTEGGTVRVNGPMAINSTLVIPTYTDNQNAKDNALAVGRPYKTPGGDLKIVV